MAANNKQLFQQTLISASPPQHNSCARGIQQVAHPSGLQHLFNIPRNKQKKLRLSYEENKNTGKLSNKEAYENRLKIDWKKEEIAIPSFTGRKHIIDFFNITEPNNAFPKYFSIAFLRELSACFLNAEPVSKFCPEILIFKKTILQKY